MHQEERKRRAIELVKEKHKGQFRGDGTVPVWHHLARVAHVLEFTLEETGEGRVEDRQDIALAGFGHDALEDTDVTEEELRDVFGERGLGLIVGMTNRFGDDHPAPYVEQVRNAEEGVRLIKLADLYDNCTSVTYCLFTLGTEWAEGYFLPIVRPMIAAVTDTAFTEYPVAAGRLKDMVRTSYDVLLAEVERYKGMGK